jgi:hypothetical protein
MEKRHAKGGKARRSPRGRHSTHHTTEDVIDEATEENHEHEDAHGNKHETSEEDARHEIDHQTEELEHEMHPEEAEHPEDEEDDEQHPEEDEQDQEEEDSIQAQKSKSNPMDDTLAEAEKENQKNEKPSLAASTLANGGRLPEAILPGEAPPTTLSDKQVDVIARLILKERSEDCDKECERRKEAVSKAKEDCAALGKGDSCAFNRKDRPYDKVAKDRAAAGGDAAKGKEATDSDIKAEDKKEQGEVNDALKKAEEA